METQSTAWRQRAWNDTSASGESAYEESWYQVLKRLSEEGASDDADAGGDDGVSG
jgi:hypothetical protein